MSKSKLHLKPLSRSEVRWSCPLDELPVFETTDDVEPARSVVGQEAAVDALRFGLEHYAPGQNIYVRGLTGTGRMTLLRELLEHIVPTCPLAPDRCYVHNFEEASSPRLLTLPRGRARGFVKDMDAFIEFIREDLPVAMRSESFKDRRSAIERAGQAQLKALAKPFEKELEAAGLGLVFVHAGPVTQSAIFPLVDGKPVPPEEFESLHAQSEITDEDHERVVAGIEKYEPALEEISERIHDLRSNVQAELRKCVQSEARKILDNAARDIRRAHRDDAIEGFLDAVINDVVEMRLGADSEDEFTNLYRVNLILDHGPGDGCPIIVEHSPNLMNLLGTIDVDVGPEGVPRSSHMMIKPGALLRADGGYLILDARDIVSENGSWKILIRTLRTGRLDIVPQELTAPWGRMAMKPEAIDLNVKVILIGDSDVFHILDQADPDFPQLFKVLADFDSEILRDRQSFEFYAKVLARIAKLETLHPFDRSAVGRLIEHGARVAAQADKLTARFSRLADIAREASFITQKDGRDIVTGADIQQTVARTKRRASLPSRRFQEYLANGTIRVETTGRAVGQINGLAVLSAGQLVYGFPSRITATIGAGSDGVINIEGESELSGAIHTKGFHILGGLLRRLLRPDHPLAFTASIAFEQSYGGIDGDSASGAEICCLLSALTDVPIRQDLAMTGAIDQHGQIMAIGGVNEKIEGFYDTCAARKLTGDQGVIIPRANARDLMLRDDVADACGEGRFHVYAVERVEEALEILTGVAVGDETLDGRYPPGTLLAIAVERARAYWEKTAVMVNTLG